MPAQLPTQLAVAQAHLRGEAAFLQVGPPYTDASVIVNMCYCPQGMCYSETFGSLFGTEFALALA